MNWLIPLSLVLILDTFVVLAKEDKYVKESSRVINDQSFRLSLSPFNLFNFKSTTPEPAAAATTVNPYPDYTQHWLQYFSYPPYLPNPTQSPIQSTMDKPHHYPPNGHYPQHFHYPLHPHYHPYVVVIPISGSDCNGNDSNGNCGRGNRGKKGKNGSKGNVNNGNGNKGNGNIGNNGNNNTSGFKGNSNGNDGNGSNKGNGENVSNGNIGNDDGNNGKNGTNAESDNNENGKSGKGNDENENNGNKSNGNNESNGNGKNSKKGDGNNGSDNENNIKKRIDRNKGKDGKYVTYFLRTPISYLPYLQNNRMLGVLQTTETKLENRHEDNDYEDEASSHGITTSDFVINDDYQQDYDLPTINTKDMKMPVSMQIADNPVDIPIHKNFKTREQQDLVYLRHFQNGKQVEAAKTN